MPGAVGGGRRGLDRGRRRRRAGFADRCARRQGRAQARFSARPARARQRAARRPAARPQTRRVKDVREQLQPVDQARSRAREVGGGVHRDDPSCAERRELWRAPGLRACARRVIAARHHDDHLRLGRGDLSQSIVCDGSPAQPEEVLASGVLDQLRRPVTGDEDRVEPLERGDRAAPRCRARRAHAVDAPGCARTSATPRHAAGRLRRPCATSPSVSPSVLGSSAITRCDGSSRGEPLDLLIGDGADRAQRLRDDQVRLQRRSALARRARRSIRRRSVRSRTGRVDLAALRPAGQVSRVTFRAPGPAADSRTRG